MYHPIKPINCAALNKLNEIAHLTVAFGLTNYDVSSNEAQIKVDFVEYLKDHDYPQAGEWLWRKWKVIKRPLLELLAIPVGNKEAVLTALNTDRGDVKNNSHFAHKRLLPDCEPIQKLVGQIFYSFYENILAPIKGVPGSVLEENGNLTRQTILEIYRDTQHQEGIFVCPGCDGKALEEADGKIFANVDHFFPKALYPVLAIHPLNLTPFCHVCNQDFKGSKDPLEATNGDQLQLSEIYHPYWRPGRHEIEARIERGSDDLPHLKLHPRNSDDPSIRCLQSLNDLLCLESRWDSALQSRQVGKRLKREINYYIRDEHHTPGFVPDDNWLSHKLTIVGKMYENAVGEVENQVLEHAYVRWVCTEDQVRNEWLQYVMEVMN